MSNVLSKLNATLEHRLSVLSEPGLTGEQLQTQLQINKSITDVAKEITSVHRLALDATRLDLEYGRKGWVSSDLRDVAQLEVNQQGVKGVNCD